MLDIILIRPGATEYDCQGRVQGTLDIPLCDQGRDEVSALIQQLRDQEFTAVYTSPSQAAQQTAQALADDRDLRRRLLEKLQNLNHGLWQGMLVDDVKLKQPKVYRKWLEQPNSVCPPEGETVASATSRAEAVLAKLIKKHKKGPIALVVPEPMASIVRQVLQPGEWGDLWDVDSEAQWERISVELTNGVKG